MPQPPLMHTDCGRVPHDIRQPAVYPSDWEYAQGQPRFTHRTTSCFSVSNGFFGGQWHEIHPQYWTKYQVWEWLQHLLDTNQLDASCIPFQEFDINGEHLCNMSLQEFTRAAGTAGQLLYSNLQHLKWNGDYLSPYLARSQLRRAETLQLAGFLGRGIKRWSPLQTTVSKAGK